ncbi:hypothetical protein QTP88_010883 [Uroleucon formosanum]
MCISCSRYKGLFFHLCQSIWRHIELNGLQSNYSNDSDYALNLRKLAALAYIPENDVVSAYKTLLESQFYQQEIFTAKILLRYFDVYPLNLMSMNCRLDRHYLNRFCIFSNIKSFRCEK